MRKRDSPAWLAVIAITLASNVVAVADESSSHVSHPQSGTAATLSCGVDKPRQGILTVRVVDELGAPMPGATVTIVESRQSAILASGVTGTDGTLDVKGVADKPAFVIASQLGFHSAGVEAYVLGACEGVVTVALAVAGTICDIEVTEAAPEPR